MITVLGSLNMDLVIEAPRIPAPGETILGTDFRKACGGKGANQACAIARMGMGVSMIGAVGADAFGGEMIEGLRAAGVDTNAVFRRAEAPSGTAMIVVDAAGQNQIVVTKGANDTLTEADVESRADVIRQSRGLVLQLETPISAAVAASEIAEKARIPIFFNPAPHAPVPAEFLQRCTFLIPNEAEAGQMSGVIIEDVASASTAARRLRDMAPRSVVVITLGAMGVWVETNEFAGHVPGFSVDAVDTVGAGDTFVGAFAVRILEGAGVRDAACFGCAAAALSVTRRGAQSSIPSRAEVESWLRGHA